LETKTLKQWMNQFGYKWVDGQEQMFKGEMTYGEAADQLGQLLREGAVSKV
jgi:hypothetical protein